MISDPKYVLRKSFFCLVLVVTYTYGDILLPQPLLSIIFAQ
jgi:hypothetical protein